MSTSQVVFVTGVSSGIGRATAELLTRRGCTVYGSVRDLQKATPIPGVILLEMDVRDEASVQHAVRCIVEASSRIDVLINNAGGSLLGAIEETTVEEAQALFDTNVFGALRTIRAVMPQMRAQRAGRIINVSSVLGFLPAPYMGLYSASKHAVEGMSETLDHEVRHLGIRVVLVEPSYTKTHLDQNAPQVSIPLPAYDAARGTASQTILKQIQNAPAASTVAATIVEAALGRWQMRRTPKGEATLLSRLRRFLPAGMVDASLRKSFGLS